MGPPVWLSLACGLDAVSCRAMTGGFPPLSRMGGKRAVADHVLQILGVWPRTWLMIDADPAIIEFWQAAFGGWLPAVAEIIRQAPCDGEELWRLWKDEPVPVHPLERVARWEFIQAGQFGGGSIVSAGGRWFRGREGRDAERPSWKTRETQPSPSKHILAARNERLARWIVLQTGNFSGKPLSWREKWEGVAGFKTDEPGPGYHPPPSAECTAASVEAFWKGVAGYASLSDAAKRAGFATRFSKAGTAQRLDDFGIGHGSAIYLDLATSSPVFRAGDLVTIDPPYRGTTGYGPDLSRERVVELALEAHECGCRVLVHEAEPVLAGGPWRAVVLERRVGKNQRTWSKQRSEWVTINFRPARTVSHTMALPVRKFGGFEGELWR